MKNKFLILAVLVISCVLIYFFMGGNSQVETAAQQSTSSSDSQQVDLKKNPQGGPKTFSVEQISSKIKLSETEKKFLNSYSTKQSDLVIAQAILLSRHDPNSSMVTELRNAVLLNPQLSIISIAKFINDDTLPGYELEKTALLSLGSQIAPDEDSKQTLIEASKTELNKMVDALEESATGSEKLTGPEAEMSFIQSLNKQDADKLAAAVSYFKNVTEGIDGVAGVKDIVNVIKEIDHPVLKNILARKFYETNKEKLSPDALMELKEVGVNYAGYAKKLD